MGIIEQNFNRSRGVDSDIQEHLETLRRYSSLCDSVVEMGVRYIVSTWALLAGKPRKMISIDIQHPAEIGADLAPVYGGCKEYDINFEFIKSSTLDITIEETDLLFIDTLHTYDQLSKELFLHGNKAKKFIILHDTTSFSKELLPAIDEFLKNNTHWVRKEVFQNNNGLTILHRV